jgi:myo-inositol 2-dehydrogenase/D-chiro-inositol 1-dehydrogenase
MNDKSKIKRREFVKHSTLATGAVVMSPLFKKTNGFNSSVDDTIKISLVGCGGRGSGAAAQALLTKENVKLVSMADAFRDNLDESLEEISKEAGTAKIDVPEERKYVGFDAYMKAIPHCDVVILATPPGFRPIHFAEAIAQNKHVFMEKPLATDGPGVRKILETAKEASRKRLNVIVGLQRHYQEKYLQMMDRIHSGKIGDILSAQVYWNSSGVWVRERKPGQTEMEYQMRNWYYFNWLCGDHIVEQHIHNIDIANWAVQNYPVSAQGMGGREVRKDKDHGEIFDHHYVEFQFADGSYMNSQCRHIKNCWNRVNEIIIGTKGMADFGEGILKKHSGKVIYQHDSSNDPNPYQVEHDVLFEAIARGEYKFADTENGAKSTMTAILGRMATYSGRMISWDDAINSKVSLLPEKFAWDANPPVMPNNKGFYPIPVPGDSKTV